MSGAAESHCEQRAVITEIKAAVLYFQKAEERREAREERMAKAMEDLAAQGARIDIIERNEENIFARLGTLERAPGEDAGKVRTGFWNALIAATIALVVGLVVKR